MDLDADHGSVRAGPPRTHGGGGHHPEDGHSVPRGTEQAADCNGIPESAGREEEEEESGAASYMVSCSFPLPFPLVFLIFAWWVGYLEEVLGGVGRSRCPYS